MSDNELDELLAQLKDSYKTNRHVPSNENHLHILLKRIDSFINKRQTKLHNHQKRLDDLQRDLILSENESSKHRVELEKKDFEVHQLHKLLNKTEQTTQLMMNKYDNEVQKLMSKLCNVQHEYERLKLSQKRQSQSKINDEFLAEIQRLRERNQILENENELMKKEILSQQRQQDLNQLRSTQNSNSDFVAKINSLENEIEFYKRRVVQQQIEINRLEKLLQDERTQMKTILEKSRENSSQIEINRLEKLLQDERTQMKTILEKSSSENFRSALIRSENECNLLRLELQRLQAEKEIIKVNFLEEKISEKNDFDSTGADSKEFEIFVRHELKIDAEKTNRLIDFWNEKQKSFQNRIRQISLEIEKNEKKTNNFGDRLGEISHLNETILHAKRDVNQLQMELTDKNTTIYNLYKKIECLEQALNISKQRINSQLKEIQDLRAKQNENSASIREENEEIVTDEDERRRSTISNNRLLRTSSPIKSGSVYKHFHKYEADSTPSMNVGR